VIGFLNSASPEPYAYLARATTKSGHFPGITYGFKFAVLVRGDVDGGQGQTAPAAMC
jgi:hypothetical protein